MQDQSLDLADIQGNVLRAYRFPHASYLFVNFTSSGHGVDFVNHLLTQITTAEEWPAEKPAGAVNVALSQTGLQALELPLATLNSFPAEFLEGMAQRAGVLLDVGESAPENWEAMWQGRIDAVVSVFAQTQDALDAYVESVLADALTDGGVVLVGTQQVERIKIDGLSTTLEHFGYTDGISQPDFQHSLSTHTPGDGKLAEKGRWKDLETGDFLLGYSNEALEIEAQPLPPVFAKNGTYMVMRKLEQDVIGFRNYVREWGELYPGGEAKLRAKLMGRWDDGTPVMTSPETPDATLAADEQRLNDFTYADDPEGIRCPLGAHVRRSNPRDSLGFGDALVARRRILRRGVPYGPYAKEGEDQTAAERGLMFICLNANLARQFEFVQQQWINYGNDLGQGEDTDPVVGNRSYQGRFVIPGDPAKGEEPFVCSGMQSFVTLKGGAYFFVPSVTALQMIGSNAIDPR